MVDDDGDGDGGKWLLIDGGELIFPGIKLKGGGRRALWKLPAY
jgi:hypothetical protein